MIFKVNVNLDMGNMSLSTRMLDVLYALDGTSDIASVSSFLKIRMHDLRHILHKLYQHKLIVRIEKTVPMLNNDFISSSKIPIDDKKRAFQKAMLARSVTKT